MVKFSLCVNQGLVRLLDFVPLYSEVQFLLHLLSTFCLSSVTSDTLIAYHTGGFAFAVEFYDWLLSVISEAHPTGTFDFIFFSL